MGESQRDKREDFFAAVLFAGMNHNSGGVILKYREGGLDTVDVWYECRGSIFSHMLQKPDDLHNE